MELGRSRRDLADHNTNLTLTQFYDGAVHPLGGNLVLGGAQDNGTSRGTGSTSWPLIVGGDGADNAIAFNILSPSGPCRPRISSSEGP